MQIVTGPVFISTGSNCENADSMLAQALERISLVIDIEKTSAVYLTEPQDYREQPWFHNQVIQGHTRAKTSPQALLKELLAIETDLGRKRGQIRFGPRCIDIDLLLFGNLSSTDPACILPHPRMTKRAFALVPLLEIAPDLKIGDKTAADCLRELAWRRDGQKIFQ